MSKLKDYSPAGAGKWPAPAAELPPGGFGGTACEAKQTPDGFAETTGEAKLPPGGFGGTAREAEQPPDGFAETTGVAKLPPGGFGGTAREAEQPPGGDRAENGRCRAKKPLIVIAGPTASGKSDLAVEIARRMDGEVVSADSMQVYRTMDIGSAKITLEEMMGVPHHMIDVADPTEAFDVVRYAGMARACISEIYGRGHIPILCGGTGFYIQAVTRDIDFTETGAREDIRSRLEAFAASRGNEALHARLASVDPAAAAEIHPNNIKRVVRALEFYEETGMRISDHNAAERLRESPYDLAFYVITDDREKLYERIDRRVDFMMAAGLWDEVAFLRAMGLTRDMVSMQGLGYKEMLDAMDGVISYDEAVRILKRDSRHYAKRQITWFKREKEAVWVDRSRFDGDSGKMLEFILGDLESKLGITAHAPRHPFA